MTADSDEDDSCTVCGAAETRELLLDSDEADPEELGAICDDCRGMVTTLLYGNFEPVHVAELTQLRRIREAAKDHVAWGICAECGVVRGDSVEAAPPTPSSCGECGSTLEAVSETIEYSL